MGKAYPIALVFLLLVSGVLAITYHTKSQVYTSPITTESLAYIDSVSTPNQTWLNFDGVNDYVNIVGFTTNNFSNGISIFAWARDLKGTGGTIVSARQEYWFRITSSGGLATSFIDLTDNLYNIVAPTINDSNWHHLGIDYNGTDMEGFFNGLSLGIDDSTGTVNTVHPVNLGRRSVDDDSYLNGSIDEVYIYNFSNKLHINNIKNLRNNGLNIPALMYHRIGENDLYTNVNMTNFAEQMAYLNSSGFQTITLTDWYDWTQGKKLIPNKPVMIFFDDSYKSIITNASSIMDSYGFVGIIGVISNEITWSTRMNTSDLINRSNAGWEIASHSINSTRLTDMSITDRIIAFNQSRWDIYNNISVFPVSFIYPSNAHNSTLDSECSDYYTICTGGNTYSSEYPVGTLIVNYADFVYKTTNPIGGINRTYIFNTTTLQKFAKAVNLDYGLLFRGKLNENSGTKAYDSSGNSNNGTISGATWQTDGQTRTLTDNIDYSDSSGVVTILNTEYLYSYLTITYHLAAESVTYFVLALEFIINLLPIAAIICVYIVFSMIWKQRITWQSGVMLLIFVLLLTWILTILLGVIAEA